MSLSFTDKDSVSLSFTWRQCTFVLAVISLKVSDRYAIQCNTISNCSGALHFRLNLLDDFCPLFTPISSSNSRMIAAIALVSEKFRLLRYLCLILVFLHFKAAS